MSEYTLKDMAEQQNDDLILEIKKGMEEKVDVEVRAELNKMVFRFNYPDGFHVEITEKFQDMNVERVISQAKNLRDVFKTKVKTEYYKLKSLSSKFEEDWGPPPS